MGEYPPARSPRGPKTGGARTPHSARRGARTRPLGGTKDGKGLQAAGWSKVQSFRRKAPTRTPRTPGPLDALPPRRRRPWPRAINKINSAEGACGVWRGSRAVPTGRGTLAQGSVSSPSPPGGSLSPQNGSARKAQHMCVPKRSFGPRRFTCLLFSLPRSPLVL